MTASTNEDGPIPPEATSEAFPIVGVGASAGGLEAITELLKKLPSSPGIALVLVQHLDPHHESLMREILSRETRLPVLQAADGMAVEKNHVYVIPPNAALTIAQGVLKLQPREEVDGPFMPIDIFFRSLAHDQGAMSACIVLSGGGTDGAIGLEEIKGADGVTFVQDEESARQTAMPRSAAATGSADFVLPPGQIAHELVRLAQRRFSWTDKLHVAPVGEANVLSRIFAMLRLATGIDFSQYKRTTIRRRIDRRMSFNRVEQLEDYVSLLEDDPAELHALSQDFLIRVTSFFRDANTFAQLQSTVLPSMLQSRPLGMPVRLWVAGCSTGEEVYSLAISLVECMGDMVSNTPVKILATDISDAQLEKARAGKYIDNIALDVSPERLRRFFVKTDGCYLVSKSIRDLCVFSKHNVTRDTPFANLDLISCRNVLIYFDSPLQKRVLPFFHYALKPDGYLMLGSAETIGPHTDLFEVVDKESRIYSKKQTRTKVTLDFPMPDAYKGQQQGVALRQNGDFPRDVREAANRLLAHRFAPPGVLIDEQFKILELRGQTRCLQATSKLLSQNLLTVLHPELVAIVREAMEAAKAQKLPVQRGNLTIEAEESIQVALEVIPNLIAGNLQQTYVVLFEESVTPETSNRSAPESGEIAAHSDALNSAGRIAELERQLAAAQEHVQAIVEENEGANEELKAAHEEILSSNEELQSTNEELQTSKEEMQSTNEELTTVNDELKHRNRELGQVNDDLVNVLGALNMAIIMVNRELRIRRFTPAAEVLFNLIPGDLGRRITDLRPNIDLPDIAQLIRNVLDSLSATELDVADHRGHWYSLRIRPYVTADNKIDGAAILLVDVDMLKRSAEALKASRDNAEAIVETVWEPLLVLDQDLRVQRANAAFYQTFQLQQTAVEGKLLPQLDDNAWHQPELFAQLQGVIPGNTRVRDVEICAEFPKAGLRTLLVNAHRIFWEGNRTQMILMAIEDITNRKRELEQATLLASEQAARAEAEAANRMKDEFLAMLAHELRNPLAPIRNTFHILRQRLHGDALVDHALDISERQISHMARLLDDLLDVSRITRGKIQLRKELVQLQSAISRVVENCQGQIENRRHQLEVVSPAEPIYLEADSARLDQILTNLLNNAIKYTEAGGTIHLSTAQEDGWIVVRLSDTGIGIPRSLLPHIFDLFMQADHSLDRSQGGLGIGLTLVKTLVELHGGRVEALSEGRGKGSTFVVRLPALRQSKLPMPTKQGAPKQTAECPRRILVVDDNTGAAMTLSMVLEHTGHQVKVAHSGEDALILAAAERPEVILLDIGLPRMSGYEVAQKMRNELQLRDTVIVAVTGYGQEEDRRLGREAGMDYHLVKPIDLLTLEGILANVPSSKRD